MSSVFRLRTVSVLFAAAFLFAGASWGQGGSLLGRVWGIRATLTDQHPVGNGRSVDIQVDLTTATSFGGDARYGGDSSQVVAADGVETARQNLTFSPHANFLGSAFTIATTTSHKIHFKTTATGNTGSTWGTDQEFGFPTNHTSSHPNFVLKFFKGLDGTADYYEQIGFRFAGGLPGIDWGDASTLSGTQLPAPAVETTTSAGGNLFRHWRNSFSHVYADQSPHVIRVASGCCADGYSHGPGNAVTTPAAWSTFFEARIGYSSVSVDSYASERFNYLFYPIGSISVHSEGPYHLEGSLSGTFVNAFSSAVQLTASLAVGSSSIPAVGDYGLAALALMLLGAGTFLLRRA